MNWFSLRTKIIAIVFMIVSLLGVGAVLHARDNLLTILQGELEKRGVAVAKDIATRGANLILIDDVFSLYELINDTLVHNEEVRYTFIIERPGKVRVSSFEKGIPKGLLVANSLDPGQDYSVKIIETDEGIMRDIAVPVFEGKVGVARVGMSETRIREQVDSFFRYLLILVVVALIAGIAASYVLATLLTRPIFRLVEAVRAVGRGELNRKSLIYTRDEIGQLSKAFDAMTDELSKSRDELLRRNQELSILNAVAATVSRPLNLVELLNSALDKVQEVMKLDAGWIFLRTSNGREERLEMVAHRGLSPQSVKEEAQHPQGDCFCRQVLNAGEASVMGDKTCCPRSYDQLTSSENLACRACVPLRAKDKIIGILNVASKDKEFFSSDDLLLLTSIGQQIGVAVENVQLYEEVQRKEELHGQLLEKIITAQEDERKRIARELHDESAQSLSALVMSLEAAERALPITQMAAREKIGRSKFVANATLGEVRKLIMNLRPSTLDDLGIISAVRWYAERTLEDHGVEIDFESVGFKRRLPLQLETALFRIMQEAINNISKHAKATKAKIHLNFEGSVLLGLVEDNGKGFDLGELRNGGTGIKGLGLLGMQERVVLFGGKFSIKSLPGVGTQIMIEVPVDIGGNENG